MKNAADLDSRADEVCKALKVGRLGPRRRPRSNPDAARDGTAQGTPGSIDVSEPIPGLKRHQERTTPTSFAFERHPLHPQHASKALHTESRSWTGSSQSKPTRLSRRAG